MNPSRLVPSPLVHADAARAGRDTATCVAALQLWRSDHSVASTNAQQPPNQVSPLKSCLLRGPSGTPRQRFATFPQVQTSARARRKELMSALEEVSAASVDLATLLSSLGVVTHEAMGQVEGGGKAIDLAASMDLANRREILNKAADRMRNSRHQVQRAFFLLALAEGSSRAEVARVWRVSRQLVSRMTAEEPTAPEDNTDH